MVSVGREEEQGHQHIEQGGGGGHLYARGGIVGGGHGQTHLHIDDGSRQQGDIKEEVDRQSQHIAQKQLQQKGQRQSQQAVRQRPGGGRRHKDTDGQHQNKAAFDNPRDASPAQQGVKEDTAAHPARNQQE